MSHIKCQLNWIPVYDGWPTIRTTSQPPRQPHQPRQPRQTMAKQMSWLLSAPHNYEYKSLKERKYADR